jgi:hypothetical protein
MGETVLLAITVALSSRYFAKASVAAIFVLAVNAHEVGPVTAVMWSAPTARSMLYFVHVYM